MKVKKRVNDETGIEFRKGDNAKKSKVNIHEHSLSALYNISLT